jgi:hypothetical protein
MNPVMYAYHNLKTNAKRRGHKFALTFEYFVKWCKETNYIDTKGRTSKAATIDRIIDELGYVDGNIQVLTLAENIRKFYVHYRL